MADEIDHGPRIGADPEVFVKNAEGILVPICGHIGGTKENPIILTKEMRTIYGENRRDRETEGDFAVQEDNVMLEFNVPAYRDYIGFATSIPRMMDYINTSVLAEKGLALYPNTSTHKFETDVLAKYPQSQTVGCSPDFDAYAKDGQFERKPFTAQDLGDTRYCGGHIHLQYNKDNVPTPVMAKFLDLVYLQYLTWDKQKARRKFYGQPGIFREKPYGIEYRTPSNFWLKPDFRDGRLGNFASSFLELGSIANKNPDRLKALYGKISWSDVRKAISEENVKLSNEISNHVHTLGLFI